MLFDAEGGALRRTELPTRNAACPSVHARRRMRPTRPAWLWSSHDTALNRRLTSCHRPFRGERTRYYLSQRCAIRPPLRIQSPSRYRQLFAHLRILLLPLQRPLPLQLPLQNVKRSSNGALLRQARDRPPRSRSQPPTTDARCHPAPFLPASIPHPTPLSLSLLRRSMARSSAAL